jgi:hypothetical protein
MWKTTPSKGEHIPHDNRKWPPKKEPRQEPQKTIVWWPRPLFWIGFWGSRGRPDPQSQGFLVPIRKITRATDSRAPRFGEVCPERCVERRRETDQEREEERQTKRERKKRSGPKKKVTHSSARRGPAPAWPVARCNLVGTEKPSIPGLGGEGDTP